jgi:hypothetical protein
MTGSGKVVILDSGFCVLQALVELRKVGVFASAVVKKRRYWPKYIKGEDIIAHMKDKEVGDDDAMSGTLDGERFHVFVMKDAGFTSILMSTYGTTERQDHEAKRYLLAQEQSVKFMYPEVFSNHYKYRGLVDCHNAKRHAPIGFETTWATKTWEKRVFAFLLAVTEVNIFLVANHFYDGKHESMLDFRLAFAKEMINNKYLQQERLENSLQLRRSNRNNNSDEHQLMSLPKKKKFVNGKVVASVSNYPQSACVGCKKKVRTFCRCSPGCYRCATCFAKHYAGVDIVD